jgi:hypothetical protein
LNVWNGHGVHDIVPRGEPTLKVPTAHGLHEDVPVLEAKVPGGHGSQTTCTVLRLLYVPRLHAVQGEPDTTKLNKLSGTMNPGVQALH